VPQAAGRAARDGDVITLGNIFFTVSWRLTPPDPFLLGVAIGCMAAVVFLFLFFLTRPRR